MGNIFFEEYFFSSNNHFLVFYSIKQLRHGHLDANKTLSICTFTLPPSSTATLHLYEHMLEDGVQTLLLTMFLLNTKDSHPITRTYTMLYIEVPTTLASLTFFTGSLMFGVTKLAIFSSGIVMTPNQSFKIMKSMFRLKILPI